MWDAMSLTWRPCDTSAKTHVNNIINTVYWSMILNLSWNSVWTVSLAIKLQAARKYDDVRYRNLFCVRGLLWENHRRIAWRNGWTRSEFTDHLRRHGAHCYVTVMVFMHLTGHPIVRSCCLQDGGSRQWEYQTSWWRHQMETFSALLALCAGNSPVPGEFPHKGQWRGALMFSLICARINSWVNNRVAGDLKRHGGHCDVIIMIMVYWQVSPVCDWPAFTQPKRQINACL